MTIKVPFVDLSLQNQPLQSQLQQAFTDVINKGDFVLGQAVADFEKTFAEASGTEYGFALLLVLLATPTALPYLISPYTFPLQTFIASTAGFILNQFDMNVVVDGINLYIGGRVVEVAPCCAGLKMLLTTIYVSLMLLYWTDSIESRKITISFLSLSVFISVSANILRNTLLTFFHGTGQDGAFVWLHDSWGGDLYSACMLLLLIPLLNWMNSSFVAAPAVELEEEVSNQ